jgi:hypothetical protein
MIKITKKGLQKYFEEKILEGTCFSTLQELKNDKTLIQVNAPRALIASELSGVWRGMLIATIIHNELNKKSPSG